MSSAQVEIQSLFDATNHVLDAADLIELVSGATLRNSPPSRMVTSSPILTTSSQSCLTRPNSPSLESTFNILGDQVIPIIPKSKALEINHKFIR